MPKIDLSIELQANDFKKRILAQAKAAEKAQASAGSRAVKAGHDEVAKEAFKRVNLKKTFIKKELTSSFYSKANSSGRITIKGKSIPLTTFPVRKGTKATRKKAKGLPKARIYRGRPAVQFKGSFLADTKFGKQVLIRKGAQRKPTRRLFGPGPAELYRNESFESQITRRIRKIYISQFESTYNRFKK